MEKPTDESWNEYAIRLGQHARLQGQPVLSNPFPRPGFLAGIWERAWLYEDKILRTGDA